jgi:hypothetical protein
MNLYLQLSAVKEMGDGDVNKGAQRMYDMMKKLRKRRKSLMAETITQITQPPDIYRSRIETLFRPITKSYWWIKRCRFI